MLQLRLHPAHAVDKELIWRKNYDYGFVFYF
jgi:hypothetical protein